MARTPVAGGGDLVTYFSRLPEHHSNGAEIPLVSILEDTLGDTDPANNRTRTIWAYGYTKPTVWQRFSAAVPFLYRRAGGDRRKELEPALVLDMADPARGTTAKLLGAALQSSVLDPLGMPFRASTRAYRARTGEYRQMQIFRTVEVLRSAPEEAGGLSGEQLAQVQGRLVLATQLLGGLVTDRYAPEAWVKKRDRSAANRGRNWELLRQRAEDNGLYFEPLRIGSEDANFALVWMDQGRLEQPFDGRFLGFSDPYRDSRVRNWKGYAQTWFLDENGSRVTEWVEGGRAAKMVPLGLYALDHPKAPLLLLDFRAPSRAKRREVAWRMTDDVATGVLGFTGWGHWPYMLAKSSWFFVHGRRGAPLNRSARVQAYVQLRQGLLVDRSLPAALHLELVKGVDRLGWNAFEDEAQREATVASAQYRALLNRAEHGFSRDLDRERLHEIADQIHSPLARWSLKAGTIASLGIYRHQEQMTPERLMAVERQRREASDARMEEMLAALPPPAAARATSSGGQ